MISAVMQEVPHLLLAHFFEGALKGNTCAFRLKKQVFAWGIYSSSANATLIFLTHSLERSTLFILRII